MHARILVFSVLIILLAKNYRHSLLLLVTLFKFKDTNSNARQNATVATECIVGQHTTKNNNEQVINALAGLCIKEEAKLTMNYTCILKQQQLPGYSMAVTTLEPYGYYRNSFLVTSTYQL